MLKGTSKNTYMSNYRDTKNLTAKAKKPGKEREN
jgi:hypothetical protein